METDACSSLAKRNFVLQQGLDEPAPDDCPAQYSALLFQPRVVALIVLVGIVLREPLVFLALGVLLWWSALLPRRNPFDAVYNRMIAGRPGRFALPPAPAPRRFSQGMAGTFALAAGVALILGWRAAAIILEAFLVLAIGSLVFGSLCIGSAVYHLLAGRAAFVRRTMPWARGA
jgi:hypothetical protein